MSAACPRDCSTPELGFSPRLFDERQAAAYLSLPVISLKRLTCARVVVDGRLRWDRRALDAWIDQQTGLEVVTTSPDQPQDADAMCEAYFARA